KELYRILFACVNALFCLKEWPNRWKRMGPVTLLVFKTSGELVNPALVGSTPTTLPPSLLFFLGLCFFPGFSTQAKGASMKKTLIRLILVAAAFLALSTTTALPDGGGMPPWCPPGHVCS